MCTPEVQIGMAIFSAFNQYQQGKSAAKAEMVTAANNKKVAEFNAGIQERAGKDAISRGAEESWKERQKAVKANARLRANLTGLADSGTSLQLQGQNTGMGEVNALTVMNNAEREAHGYKMEAQSIRFGAKADAANAAYRSKIMKSNGLLDAAGTLVTGFGNYGKSKGWV